MVDESDAQLYIHLGSARILMEPNDQYLCIVRDSKPRQPVAFLPFEGDSILSEILSKALRLSHDVAIEDPTIRSQIALR